MEEFKFEKIKVLVELSKTRKASYQLSLIRWNSSGEKYDLRKWGDDGNTPYKGITMNRNELQNLYNILKDIRIDNDDLSVYKKTKVGSIDVTIYEVFGEYKSRGELKGYVTYTSWNGTPKIDVRGWNEDFSKCSKGVTLSEKEKNVLVNYLKKEFEVKLSSNEDYDTSTIDDDIFI